MHLPYLAGLIQDEALKGGLSLRIGPDMVKGNAQLEPLCEVCHQVTFIQCEGF